MHAGGVAVVDSELLGSVDFNDITEGGEGVAGERFRLNQHRSIRYGPP